MEFDDYNDVEEATEEMPEVAETELTEWEEASQDTNGVQCADLFVNEETDIQWEEDRHATSKWDGTFNGTYETSRYCDGTLETDILNAGRGIFATQNGGLVRETDSRIDVWGEGDGKGNYDHWYYNGPNDYGKAPDNRH